ncbi:MAG: hypothetical protein K2W85_12925 [Phycisphaerales bacterium]|nr:hypothetical protein [Phycisphaerales bacterium]
MSTRRKKSPMPKDPPEIAAIRRIRERTLAQAGGTLAGLMAHFRKKQVELEAAGATVLRSSPAKKKSKRARKKAA